MMTSTALVEARIGLLHRHAEPGELVVAVALADAEIEPSAGQQIECGGLLGQQHRVVPRQHQHRGAEPQMAGAGAEPGQQVEARRNLAEAGEMVLDEKGAVIAQRLGLDIVVDELAETLAAVGIGAGCASPARCRKAQIALRETPAGASPLCHDCDDRPSVREHSPFRPSASPLYNRDVSHSEGARPCSPTSLRPRP